MFVVCVIVSILLGVAVIGSGVAKLTRATGVVDSLTGIGVPLTWFPRLGAAEIAGGIGLVVGLAIAPLGVAAIVGVVLYFIGAVITHIRAEDYNGIGAPGILLVVSIAALALRLSTI